MAADENGRGHTAADAALPHVLVVDDETIISTEIVEYLRLQGFQAEAVTNGHDALKSLDADPSIDVMLSDIRMPDMDGLTLASAASERRAEAHALEVVMLTGHATVANAASSVRLRATDFLMKPVRLAVLKEALVRAGRLAVERRTKACERLALSQAHAASLAEIESLQSLVAGLQSRLKPAADAAASQDGGRNAFLSVLNHELRTPLVPIIGLAGLIEGQPGSLSSAELQEFARAIRMGGERLERAVFRITEFTSLASGQSVARHAPCKVDDIMAAASRKCAGRLAGRSQTLSSVTGTRRVLYSDSARVVQVLEELLENASRFSPEGSAISLSVRETDGNVVFTVADEGPGMTEQEIVLATQTFQQLDMSSRRPVEGLGLGLSLAMRLANLLGGKLSIQSTPGTGTEVDLKLPVAGAPDVNL